MAFHRFLSVVFTALWLLPHSAPGTDTFLPLADPREVMASAEDVHPERYPDADAVYLFSGERVRYEPDGTSVSVGESWVTVLTEKGRREQSTSSFSFNDAYGTVEILLAEIYRADGAVVPIDVASLSRIMISPDQMHSNIYDPRQKVLRLGIPGLEIGDTVRLRYVRRQTRTRMPDTWSDYTVLEAPVPLLRAVYEVEAPEERPLVHRVLNGELPGTVTAETEPLEEGRILYRWVARDVPRLFEEPAMPEWWTVAQRLLVSTIPDWETVSRWYWNLSLPRLEATTPAMQEKVSELTEGIKDRQDRLEALFRFVSQQIRYMGITTEEEAPGYEPHDVYITFENRYGVCRDKAALLVAMLRMDGFEAFPVLIHVGPRKDEEVPQPFFNHAIVAVRDPDGSFQLMDMTDETTRDLLPAYLGDRSFLVATPEGEPLRVSPVVPARDNMARMETEATLTAEGVLRGTTRIRLEGINDNAYRGYFASVKPGERRRFFEGLLKQRLSGAELRTFALWPEDMQDTSRPIEVELGFVVPEYPIRDQGTLLLQPPWFGTSIGMVNFILRATGLHERRFPLRTGYACGVEERFTLWVEDPPEPESVIVPYVEPIDTPAVSWSQELTWVDGDRLEGSASFRLHTPEFDPPGYLELKALLGDIEFNQRKWPLFLHPDPFDFTPAPEADVSYAFRRAEIEWELDGTWTETHRLRKTILTYAGIKDHAELILPFNPAWDDVELVEARVTSPGGTVQTVREEEINLMDAAWAAGAPRYPAGQTLVVNLPGVQVGSTIDLTTRRRHRGRPFFAFHESFGGTEPVGQVEVRLDAPAAAGLGIRVIGGEAGMRFEETRIGNDRIRRTWRFENPPQAIREDALPPDWILYPSLFISTGNWPAYAAELGERLTAASVEAPQAARETQRLMGDVVEPRERIRILRDFVARRIRNAGPAFIRLPLESLTHADQTLRDGYGHSADRAILLVAMLQAAGFEPAFVLVSPWPGEAAIADPLLDTPQRAVFSDVLVRVEAAGEIFFLNDTDQYAELGATSNEGALLLALPGGRIDTLRAASGHAGRTQVEYQIRLGPNGEAEIDLTRRFEGIAHAGARRRFEEMTPEDRRRYFQEAVSAISHRAQPRGELTTDFSRYPGEERFSVFIDRYAVREGGHLSLLLPGVSPVLTLRADRRTHPLWWGSRGEERILHRITAPPGVSAVLVPPVQAWSAPGQALSVHRRVHTVSGEEGEVDERPQWIVETEISRKPGLIEPGFYPELLQALRRLNHPRNRVLLFSMTDQE